MLPCALWRRCHVRETKGRGKKRQGRQGAKYKGMCYRAGCSFVFSHGRCVHRAFWRGVSESLTPSHSWAGRLVTLGNSWRLSLPLWPPPACEQASPCQWWRGDGVAPATDVPSMGTSGAVVGILWLGIKGQSTCVKPKTQASQTDQNRWTDAWMVTAPWGLSVASSCWDVSVKEGAGPVHCTVTAIARTVLSCYFQQHQVMVLAVTAAEKVAFHGGC